MIKNIPVVALVFFAFSVKAQTTVNIQWQDIKTGYTDNLIHYDSNRKLNWHDFKGSPVAASPAAAVTESGFGYQLAMQSSNNKTKINITVYCYFDKDKSWVKKGMNNDYALLHEQHHFDITYINTCLFIQKLKAAKIGRSNYASLVEKIHNECFRAMNKMQDEYDSETHNGRRPVVQDAWNRLIDLKLAALITN
jgi:hypothetical protein